MGLDNGVEIRRRPDLPAAVLRAFDVDEWRVRNNYDIEVAYWRKCWNVRDVFFDVLDIKDNNDTQTNMTANDVEQVITLLKEFTRDNYDFCGTIWDWVDFKRLNKRNIRQLKKLVKLMKKYDDLEVYFYDSW